MKRILLLFAIVYGQISGFVLSLTFLVYWLGTEKGVQFCESLGLSAGEGQALASVCLFVAFGASGAISVLQVRKSSHKIK